jgi:hypothetical protein
MSRNSKFTSATGDLTRNTEKVAPLFSCASYEPTGAFTACLTASSRKHCIFNGVQLFGLSAGVIVAPEFG